MFLTTFNQFQMSDYDTVSVDQLQYILLRYSVEIAEKYSEEELDLEIPRDVVLRSKCVSEEFRTALLNHLIQFRQKYNVNEFIILKTFQIFETVLGTRDRGQLRH